MPSTIVHPHLAPGPANDGKVIPVSRDPPQAFERRGHRPATAAALPRPPTAGPRRVPPAASTVVALLPQSPVALPAAARSSPRQAGDEHRLRQGVPRLRAARPLALLSAASQVDEARKRGVRDGSLRGVPRRRRRRGSPGAAAFSALAVGSVSLAAALEAAVPADAAAARAKAAGGGGGGAAAEAGDGFRWVRLRLVVLPEVVDG